MSVHISEDQSLIERAVSFYRERFLPIVHKISYPMMLNVVGLCLCIATIVLMIVDFSRQKQIQPSIQTCDLQIREAAAQLTAQIPENEPQSEMVTASVTGAVQKPGVYALAQGSRYVDLIATASGYAKDVHRLWIDKNINLATRIQDGEQLYVPSVHDSPEDLCAENKNISETAEEQRTAEANETKPSISTATKEQLMTIPGVGEVRAETILQGQPYSSKEDFQKRVSLPSNVMEGLEQSFQF